MAFQDPGIALAHRSALRSIQRVVSETTEPTPHAAERRDAARDLLARSSSLIVVGSSLAVMSGYRFMLDALKQGKEVSVINGGPGRGDPKATTLWRTQVAPAFDELLDLLDV